MRRRVTTLLSCLLMLAAAACRTVAGVPGVTVCEIGERPAKFADREVVISAEVRGGLRNFLFVDRRCPGDRIEAKGGGAKEWGKLEAAHRGNSSGREISGRFKGFVRVNGRSVSFELSEVIELARERN